MKRRFDSQSPELMDRPQPATPELRAALANLETLNARSGSHRLIRRFLSDWLNPDRCYRVLDLCTGAGDIPRMMLDWARPRGIVLRIDAVDANPSTIEIARELSAEYPEIRYLAADVRAFESTESYDLVCCSLSLHHFSETDAVRLLRNCRELSQHYVLVSDLERCLPTTAALWALATFLYREEMTRTDARLSAERAFSFHEFRDLAEQAGWQDFSHARFLWFRQALWLDTRTFAPVPEEAEVATLPSPA